MVLVNELGNVAMSDVATRLATALADRYRIERELGHGGMATVYLAEDLRHRRKVALKVLRPELAAVIGAERFLQEITTTANLQHPHILPLHDSGQVDGTVFYVMPFVEGESLRDRLSREKQLPVDEAVRIAREVADALEYAHQHRVIHRDIKPENILLQGGHALVADFGIALAAARSEGGARMTETGMSLGTPHYMSPEQAMGERDISARTDIYALGCVLYEMLSGEPPFTGATAQAIVARVLTEEPRSLTLQRRTVPPHLEAAVNTALAKLPADRFASAAGFAQAIADPSFLARAGSARAPARRAGGAMVPRLWFRGALAVTLLLATATLVQWLRPAADAGVTRQQVLLWRYRFPQPLDPGASFVASQVAIAPDGSSIVYADSSVTGLVLMRKLRNAALATPIPGTDAGVSPFFSPDGEWIGYFTVDGRLRKVPVTGGGSVTLAEAAGDRDYKLGAWLDDETIVYGDYRSWLSRISADGGPGSVKPLKSIGNAIAATVSPLPGARGVLFTSCNGNCAVQSDLYVYDFAADSARLLVSQAAGGWYSPTGHLLYTGREGGLFAAAFDLGRLAIRSGAVPVIDGVEPARFELSAAGMVVYAMDPASREELVWVTRDGRMTPVDTAWHGRFEYPALSPDGSALAVSILGKTTDLWIRRASGTRQKVIAGGAANWRASWMPDGKSLTFISVRSPDSSNAVAVFRAQADGAGVAERVLQYRFGVWETEVSRDGRWLVFRADEEGANSNVYARRLDGDTTLRALLVDPSSTYQVALSPDTRWLAWASNESGITEIYLASFPDMTSKRLVSRGGGTEPRWARNGRELFFKSQGQLMSVAVPPGPVLLPGEPQPLFRLAGFRAARNRPQYDVGPDGRFVMIRESGSAGGVIYAEHWFEELKAKLKR